MLPPPAKSNSSPPQLPGFNGISAIQMHLNERDQIEKNIQKPDATTLDLVMDCHADCEVIKLLHDEQVKSCSKVTLLNETCRSCEAFYEAATQAVLLTKLGMSDMAQSAILPGRLFDLTSEKFQDNLAQIHIACWPNPASPTT